MADVGLLLRAERAARGLTQAEMAARLGIGRQHLVAREGGAERCVWLAPGVAVSEAPSPEKGPDEAEPTATLWLWPPHHLRCAVMAVLDMATHAVGHR